MKWKHSEWVFFPSRVLGSQCRVHFICQTPGTEAKYSSEKTVWSCPLSSTHGSPISPNFRFAFSWARISCFLRSLEVNPHSGAFVYQFQWLSFALPSSSSYFWNIPNSHQKQASQALIWVWVGYGAPTDGSPSTWDFSEGINVWSNQASFSLSCFPTCDWSFHMNLTFLSE